MCANEPNEFLRSYGITLLYPEMIDESLIKLYALPYDYDENDKIILNKEAFKKWGKIEVSKGYAFWVSDYSFLVTQKFS